jgi:hypothetical protein
MKTIDDLELSVKCIVKQHKKNESEIKNLRSEIKHFQTMANLNCCNSLLSLIKNIYGHLPAESQITRRIRLSVEISNALLK